MHRSTLTRRRSRLSVLDLGMSLDCVGLLVVVTWLVMHLLLMCFLALVIVLLFLLCCSAC